MRSAHPPRWLLCLRMFVVSVGQSATSSQTQLMSDIMTGSPTVRITNFWWYIALMRCFVAAADALPAVHWDARDPSRPRRGSRRTQTPRLQTSFVHQRIPKVVVVRVLLLDAHVVVWRLRAFPSTHVPQLHRNVRQRVSFSFEVTWCVWPWHCLDWFPRDFALRANFFFASSNAGVLLAHSTWMHLLDRCHVSNSVRPVQVHDKA